MRPRFHGGVEPKKVPIEGIVTITHRLPMEANMATPATTEYAPNIMALVTTAWTTYADRVVLRHTDSNDDWIDVTGREAQAHVDAVAKGLIAHGVTRGDRVGIMSRTRYEWTVLDFALWSAGAIPVPLYDTSSKAQIDWITSDADVKMVVVETEDHATLAHKVAADKESPLNEVLVIDAGALDDLVAEGISVSDEDLVASRSHAGHHDLATIMYTSGTTGRPKGVRLTHFNYVRQVAGIQHELKDVLYQEGAGTVLFLTLAHSLARLVQVVLVSSGTVIGYCPDTTKLVPLMGTFHPTLILAVPRVFEKVYNSAETKASAAGKVKIFRWAAKQAIEYSEALDSRGGPSFGLRLKHKVADKLVLHKIYNVLGGNGTWAVSGSAPLGARLGHFYRGLGLTVLEGYGLTETNAASHVNRPGNVKIGTVGLPLPGMEVTIADDGEILMRGDQMFEGYHRNQEATASSMVDGWFHTGDIGQQDADGFLTITGRKKEIIVTAGGKNVAPAVLEDRIRAYPLISQCLVVGDNKPFIGALVTLDAEALPGWLEGKGRTAMTVAEAAKDEFVLESIDRAITRANKAVSRAESVRKFEVLDTDFTIANDYLTPSMKLKRADVMADFAETIEKLYTES
jgi:long-chain acyl-CoA synthetase